MKTHAALKAAALIAAPPLMLTACGNTPQQQAPNTAPVAYTEAFGTFGTVDFGKVCDPYLVGEIHGDFGPGVEGYASPEEAITGTLVSDLTWPISVDSAKLDVVAGAPEEAAFHVEVQVSKDGAPVATYSVVSAGKGGSWVVDGWTDCSNQRIVDGKTVTDKVGADK